MDGLTLTIGAIAVELGAPLGIVLLCWRRVAWRCRGVVVLGALTPTVLFYVSCLVGYFVDPGHMDNRWVVGAVWEMTFAPFMVVLALGAGLSLVSWPRLLWGRYGMGLVAGLVAVELVTLITR